MREPTIQDDLMWIGDQVARHGTEIDKYSWKKIMKEREALHVSLKEMIEYLEDEISDESEIIDQKLYEIYKAKVARAKALLKE